MDNKEAGMLIRKLRQERGWKLKDLADKLDISFSALSKIEHGTQEITYTMLRKICIQFDITLSHFFKQLEHTININSEGIDIEQVDILTAIVNEIEKLPLTQQKALYILLKHR